MTQLSRRGLLAAPFLAALAHPSPGLAAGLDEAVIDRAARETLARCPGIAIAAMRQDQVIFSRAYGLADIEGGVAAKPETVFRIASTTKTFTAAAVLLLVADGRLSLDDRLSRHVPELPQADRVSLYQLLTHTAGLPDYAEDPVGAATVALPHTAAEMIAWIGGLKPALTFEPGTAWRYSNSNYWMLGIVIERVTGRALSAVFRERLFVPAGLTQTAFDEPADIVPGRARGYRFDKARGFLNADPISATVPGPAGGLRSTAAELAGFGQALLGGRILRKAQLARMTAPGLLTDGRPNRWGMPPEWREGLQADYGMGLFVDRRTGPLRYSHTGDVNGFHSWLALYPASEVSIAILMNSESADAPEDAVQTAVLAGI